MISPSWKLIGSSARSDSEMEGEEDPSGDGKTVRGEVDGAVSKDSSSLTIDNSSITAGVVANA